MDELWEVIKESDVVYPSTGTIYLSIYIYILPSLLTYLPTYLPTSFSSYIIIIIMTINVFIGMIRIIIMITIIINFIIDKFIIIIIFIASTVTIIDPEPLQASLTGRTRPGSSHNYVALECIPLIDCVFLFDTLSLGGIQFVDISVPRNVHPGKDDDDDIVLVSRVMFLMMVINDCVNDDNDDTVIICGDEFDDHHHHHIYSSYVSDVRLLISGKCLLLQRGRPQR